MARVVNIDDGYRMAGHRVVDVKCYIWSDKYGVINVE